MTRTPASTMIILTAAFLLTGGVISQNVRTALRERTDAGERPTVDVAKVKHELEQHGLVPHDAMYWKETIK